MADERKPESSEFILRFGAGLNTRASEDEVNDAECVAGQNFELDVDNSLFRRRRPFDLAATAPNAAKVKGFAQLEKQDGTLSTLVQAGGNVYDWDGSTGFTLVGTVNSSALLRGPLDANFTLDERVLITDLNKQEVVKQWDGTTFQTMTTGLANDFSAKYAFVAGERAFFGNVKAGTDTPHLLVGSALGDHTSLTVTNRPSTSLAVTDPFFLPAPDLKPLNGLLNAFGLTILSTKHGRIYKLSGSDAQNFALTELYTDSGASSDESLAYVGNDVAYGRQGIIESLVATDALGDVETDDLSRPIKPDVETISNWKLAYDPRAQKIYAFDTENSRVFVFYKSIRDELARKIAARIETTKTSPWSVWKTQHSSGFQTDVVMSIKDPVNGLRQVFFGGSNGEIFRMEGSGAQDGGTANITAERLSKVIRMPPKMQFNGIEGVISFRKSFQSTLTLTLEFGGSSQRTTTISKTLPAAENAMVWNGAFYWSADNYWNIPFSQRFAESWFTSEGKASEVQIGLSIDGQNDFAIAQVSGRFIGA